MNSKSGAKETLFLFVAIFSLYIKYNLRLLHI
jgi:hypothetical protein